MRVAMFSWESLHSIVHGGMGVHVTELAAGLERRGHDMHVITRRAAHQSPYDQIHGVHYHRVDHGFAEDDFITTMDLMCKAMAQRFGDVTESFGPFDLVHGHDWLTAKALEHVTASTTARHFLTMHSTQYGRDGNVFEAGLAQWIRDAEAAACRSAHTVIAVSAFLADELRRLYHVPDWKIHVVPNGVAYHHFDGFIDPAAIKGRFGIGPMDPTIFAPGRMTRQKGMDMLVEAVPAVLQTYPQARFIISGSGPEAERVIERASAVGAANACVFLDVLRRADYIDVMRAVDVVVVPSRNEPFGVVALEAWAAGKPVVATSAGGPREFIWHDVNGFLVDPTPAGLAFGISSLLANHEHCRWLGRNGRRAVEQVYNWDTVAGYTEGVYNFAMAHAPAPTL